MDESSRDLIRTPRYLQILAAADDLARQLGHPHTGAEHLFLTLLRDRHSLPAQILETKLDIIELDAALVGVMTSAQYLGATGDDEPPDGD